MADSEAIPRHGGPRQGRSARAHDPGTSHGADGVTAARGRPPARVGRLRRAVGLLILLAGAALLLREAGSRL